MISRQLGVYPSIVENIGLIYKLLQATYSLPIAVRPRARFYCLASWYAPYGIPIENSLAELVSLTIQQIINLFELSCFIPEWS